MQDVVTNFKKHPALRCSIFRVDCILLYRIYLSFSFLFVHFTVCYSLYVSMFLLYQVWLSQSDFINLCYILVLCLRIYLSPFVCLCICLCQYFSLFVVCAFVCFFCPPVQLESLGLVERAVESFFGHHIMSVDGWKLLPKILSPILVPPPPTPTLF